jgi:PHD/YefM family antitoxin component YafN of YafNO toxin-antitoxin module
MKYDLDETVIYAGEICTVWDYDQRRDKYTLNREGKPRVYCVPESKLTRHNEELEAYRAALREIRDNVTWGNANEASHKAYLTADKALKKFENKN